MNTEELSLAPIRQSVFSRWLVMVVLALSGAVIYLLPFLREIFYEPLRMALGLTHSQSGAMVAAFGLTSMIAYIPGGWIADRIEPRLLISGSLVSTGLLGFWLATLPSYPAAVLIHALWGVSVTGMMWGALIKATRDWASAREQGRAFGFLEGGRGMAEAGMYSLFLAVFVMLGGGERAIADVIMQISALHLALGILAYFSIGQGGSAPAQNEFDVSLVVRAVKMPQTWLISVVVLACYSAYWGAYYFTPYASDVFLMSVTAAGAIAAGKVWLKPIAAVATGFAADRFGISQAVIACFALMTLSFVGFVILPGGASFVGVMIVNIALASISIFAMRGIYFALLEESRVPTIMTGTATGLISAFGFTPDVFMPLVGGALLDAFPGGAGYRYLFGIIALLCVCGIAATLGLRGLSKARRS
jgi:nitrate/nitrite transporter NarK